MDEKNRSFFEKHLKKCENISFELKGILNHSRCHIYGVDAITKGKSWNLTITTDFSAVGLTSKETISVQKEIVFANNNFLVFKEKSNSIFSRIIPRKQIYIRVN